MKVTVTGIAVTEQGLRLGLTIQHEKAGWIRFAGSMVLYETLSAADMRSLVQWWHQSQDQAGEERDEPLPITWA